MCTHKPKTVGDVAHDQMNANIDYKHLHRQMIVSLIGATIGRPFSPPTDKSKFKQNNSVVTWYKILLFYTPKFDKIYQLIICNLYCKKSVYML